MRNSEWLAQMDGEVAMDDCDGIPPDRDGTIAMAGRALWRRAIVEDMTPVSAWRKGEVGYPVVPTVTAQRRMIPHHL